MNTKNIIAGVLGGVVRFFLGWIIYGMLLMSYMEENMASGFNRAEEDMQFPALVAGNLFFGFFLAYIFSAWASARSLVGGMKVGFVIGLLMSAGIGMELFAVSTIYNNMTAVLVDMGAIAVITAITGGVVGWWMGRGDSK